MRFCGPNFRPEKASGRLASVPGDEKNWPAVERSTFWDEAMIEIPAPAAAPAIIG